MSAADQAQPRATGNAHLLAGYLAGRLPREGLYAVEELGNPLVVRNTETETLFRVQIEQISGEE